jgi:hypothetical protein
LPEANRLAMMFLWIVFHRCPHGARRPRPYNKHIPAFRRGEVSSPIFPVPQFGHWARQPRPSNTHIPAFRRGEVSSPFTHIAIRA